MAPLCVKRNILKRLGVRPIKFCLTQSALDPGSMSEFVIMTSPRGAGLRVRMRMDEAGSVIGFVITQPAFAV
jgi:hypothetical protein